MIKELYKDDLYLRKAKEWDVRGNQNKSIELVQDLEDTLETMPDKVYLCANEIGHIERAFDMKFSDDYYVFYNPLFQKMENMTLVRERDRHNGKEYFVPRFSTVELIYQDTLGSVRASKFENTAAFWICQAMDTLNGLFASDYGLEILPEFDKATEEEKEEVIRVYIESIPKMFSVLDNDLSNDPETKQSWNASKFIKAVNKGEVELDKEEEKPLSKRKQKLYNKFAKMFKHNDNRLKFWRKNNASKSNNDEL